MATGAFGLRCLEMLEISVGDVFEFEGRKYVVTQATGTNYGQGYCYNEPLCLRAVASDGKTAVFTGIGESKPHPSVFRCVNPNQCVDQ